MSRDLPRHIASAIDAAPHVLRETDALREIAMSPRTQRQLDLADSLIEVAEPSMFSYEIVGGHDASTEALISHVGMLEQARDDYWDRPIAQTHRETRDHFHDFDLANSLLKASRNDPLLLAHNVGRKIQCLISRLENHLPEPVALALHKCRAAIVKETD